MTTEELDLIVRFAGSVGGNALLVAFLWAVLTGRIITKGHHDEVVGILEERIRRIKNGRGSFPFPDSDD